MDTGLTQGAPRHSGHLDLILQADDNELLTDAGSISAKIAKAHAESEFEKYRVIQDRLFESDFDKQIKNLEEQAGLAGENCYHKR